ncbi:MAG: hypothetical protein HY360_04450 [Verrucomicrobia bacterium]|nr:hypothetical protein [Verrucomicrobiota bacterium]
MIRSPTRNLDRLVAAAVVIFLSAIGVAPLRAPAAEAPVFFFDFGTKDSPVAEGSIQATRDTKYQAERKCGWTVAPQGEYDRPNAYPLDALTRDGVSFTTANPMTFRVDLPNGDYIVEAILGDRNPLEYRPGMYVRVNGKKVLSGLMGSCGGVMPARAEAKADDGKLIIEFGNIHPTPATGSLNVLVIRKAEGPLLQWRRIPGESLSPSVRWLAEDKLRIVYGAGEFYQYDKKKNCYVNRSEEMWKRLADLGFNAFCASYEPEAAAFCKKRKIHFFHDIKFASDERYTLSESRITKAGVADCGVDVKPSPLDSVAWQELMVNESLRAHRQAKADGLPLDGVIIDLEMYGAKFGDVYNSRHTFDDATYGAFAKEHPELGDPGNVAVERRLDYLASKKLLAEYYRFMEKKMEAIARDVERQIHAQAPDLVIGFLQYFDNWFYRGFIRGIGTPSMPVLAFTEQTYYGYNFNARWEYDWFRKENMHSLYYPGFWPKTIHPDNMAAMANAAAAEADGYWVYGFAQTDEKNAPLMDAAIKKANRKIVDLAKDGRIDCLQICNHDLSPLQSESTASEPFDPDKHETKLDPIPDFADAVFRFDFGTPTSPAKAGWKRVLSADLFNEQTKYGWERLPRFSFNRQEHSKDPLVQDGVVVAGRNRFLLKLPKGDYEVAVILGDMAPGEWRTHQNVRLNGKDIATDITTNGGEYRVLKGKVASDGNRPVAIEFEGRGSQQYVTILGLAVRKMEP